MLRKWPLFIPIALFVIAFAMRLPDIGGYLTPDENIWAMRTAQFTTALQSRNWQATNITGHPGVTTTWAGSIGLLLFFLIARPEGVVSLGEVAQSLAADPTQLEILPWLRLPVALFTALAIVIIYLLVRRLLSESTALLSAILLIFSPFLLAHSRLLQMDALLAWTIGIAWLSLLVASRTGDRRYLFLSGISFGLAILTKSPALVMGPLMVGWIIACHWRKRSTPGAMLRSIVVDLVYLGLPAIATVILLWPALWVTPLITLQRVWNLMTVYGGVPHELGSYWLGQPVDEPGSLFYVAIMFWRTTPVTLIGLILALAAWLWSMTPSAKAVMTEEYGERHSAAGYSDRYTVGGLFLAIVWFGFWISVGSKKADRYLLPVFPFLVILASWGWISILKLGRARIKKKYSRKGEQKNWLMPTSSALVVLLVTMQMGFAIANLPSYLTAYNPLVGGIATAKQVFLVGWGEGLEQAASYLNQHPAADEKRTASWYGSNVFSPFFRGDTFDLFYDLRTASDLYVADIDYVVTYVNQLQRELLDDSVRRSLDEPIFSANKGGVPLVQVFAWPKPFSHTTDQELATGFRLLGWSLGEFDPVDNALPISLYWDANQVHLSDRPGPVVVWMKDATGEVWATAESSVDESQPPVSGWLDQPVIGQSIHLHPPIGLMPGDYRIEMSPQLGKAISLGATRLGVTHKDNVGDLPVAGLSQPVVFSDSFALVGYEILSAKPDLVLDLIWTYIAPSDEIVHYFTHIVDSNEIIAAQHDGQLGALPGQSPISWSAGDLFRQRIRLTMPGGISGTYRIYVGLYDPENGQRLSITEGSTGSDSDRYFLNEISVD